MWKKISLIIFYISVYCIAESSSQLHNREHTNYSNSRSVNISSEIDVYSENLLNRINEKLTALQTLDEQQLKRLENLEYKLTRIEATEQEQYNTVRADLREVTRRIEQLDWLTNKAESGLDQIKEDVESLKRSVEGNGVVNHNRIGATYVANIPDDFPQKFHNMGTLQQSTRASIQRLERELHNTGRNLSLIFSNIKEINILLKNLPNKQFLNNAILGLKGQPLYAMVHSNPSDISNSSVPPTCKEVAAKKSGVYKISANYLLKTPFFVYCEMHEHNGGWTVIQQRIDGTVNFFKGWAEYKHGFGNIGTEYWIGLDKLHALTSVKLHELLVILEDFEGIKLFAHYGVFAIGGEKENYALSVLGTYDGTAGDSLSYSAGHKFSTFDLDNDAWNEGNCAQAHTGGWWYNACDASNLNGRYLDGTVSEDLKYQGIYWDNFHGPNYSLKNVRMMIRAVE